MMALHGFLGRPDDWEDVLPPITTACFKPAWLSRMTHAEGLPQLADLLNWAAASVAGAGGASARPRCLLGYSMGGRVAMHMLLQDRDRLWDGAVIVSASPGISDSDERARRLRSDREWAGRFRNDEWVALMSAWNGQSVFIGDHFCTADQREEDFDREELATALERGSVGGQADLRDALSRVDIPVLWLAGENDAKYRELASECADLNPLFQLRIVPNSGHRVPWTQPEAFRESVRSFQQNALNSETMRFNNSVEPGQ